jgi:hypothetical protein
VSYYAIENYTLLDLFVRNIISFTNLLISYSSMCAS